jgi:hypothetical protein
VSQRTCRGTDSRTETLISNWTEGKPLMRNGMTLANLGRVSACAAIVLAISAGRADAGRFVRTTAMKKAQPAAAAQAKAPAAAPADAKAPAVAPEKPAAPPTKAAKPAPAPAPKATCAPKKACCPAPCISYIDRTCGPVCCDNRPPVKTVLKVVNPNTCCEVEVPVCLPACCEGTPTVCARCGIILCRGVVTYDWCCGYRVVVRFTPCGDVTVVYRG